ncbi:hypothetical protein [Spirulina sp. 06S082]|uniref:hypothetical protein n=1 Tax=Spirulina sp. 06S082 TaxID=3110248 RepID=UPI002B1FFD72|nr:hypothetical protein [Spirulina sp. 06S082]MEA5468174.1 hypothetical protein [Spirulina sp. 06S082]
MQFPDYLPANCPPDTVLPASGTVYYLVNNDPPTPKDFFSKREKNPTKKPFPKAEQECQACGISVYTEIGDLFELQQKFPGFANCKPAVGTLNSDLGVIKATPSSGSSHHTFWLASGAKPWEVFKVIENEEKEQ